MAATAGIWNQTLQPLQSLAQSRPTPMTGPANGNTPSDPGSSSDSSATISANDFLTLLVTEMQNQDPTADTDPNEYIDQLVQVNSLEQLIDINQNLSTALGDSSSSSSAGASTAAQSGTASAVQSAVQSASSAAGPHKHAADPLPAVASPSAAPAPSASLFTKSVPGNLSIPSANPAAHRVAGSLSGHGP